MCALAAGEDDDGLEEAVDGLDELELGELLGCLVRPEEVAADVDMEPAGVLCRGFSLPSASAEAQIPRHIALPVSDIMYSGLMGWVTSSQPSSRLPSCLK